MTDAVNYWMFEPNDDHDTWMAQRTGSSCPWCGVKYGGGTYGGNWVYHDVHQLDEDELTVLRLEGRMPKEL